MRSLNLEVDETEELVETPSPPKSLKTWHFWALGIGLFLLGALVGLTLAGLQPGVFRMRGATQEVVEEVVLGDDVDGHQRLRVTVQKPNS